MEPIPPEVREQIFREAEQAQVLLDHPAFASVVEEVSLRYMKDFALTAPGERNLREDAYWAIRALTAIKQTLHARVERRRLIVEEEEQENNNEHIV